MFENLGQIAVGGILALLVLREVFGFLRSRNGKAKSSKSNASACPFGNPGHAKIDFTPVAMRLDQMKAIMEEARDFAKQGKAHGEALCDDMKRLRRSVAELERIISSAD